MAVAQHDDRAHDAAALVVRRGDDGRVGDRRVAASTDSTSNGPIR